MENCIIGYEKKENNVVHISRIMPKLEESEVNVIIPRNIGSYVVTGIEPHLLNSNSFAKYIKSIDFPDTIRYIGAYSFFGSGIKTLEIPPMVNEIGESAFSCSDVERVTFQGDYFKILDSLIFCSCESLRIINLPKDLRYIGEYCFHNCINLKNIIIPSKVINIKLKAFYNSGINEVIFEGPVPLQIHPTAFNSHGNRTAYVKKEYLSDYLKSERINKFFKNILPLESRQIELKYEGSRAIVLPKIDSNNENSYIDELIIPESIFIDGRKRKIIGVDQFAFFDCKLKKLTLPKSINIDNAIIDEGIEIIRK